MWEQIEPSKCDILSFAAKSFLEVDEGIPRKGGTNLIKNRNNRGIGDLNEEYH